MYIGSARTERAAAANIAVPGRVMEGHANWWTQGDAVKHKAANAIAYAESSMYRLAAVYANRNKHRRFRYSAIDPPTCFRSGNSRKLSHLPS